MRTMAGLGIALLLAAALQAHAGAQPEIAVSVSSALQARLEQRYGAEEGAVLRGFVTDSLGKALARRATAPPADLRIEVVLDDARPSHPTRRQSLDEPSIDPLRSRSLGGAELEGTVRDASGRLLASVSHQHFPSDFATASAAGDPWADARIAIDQFTALLARKIPAPR